MIRNLKKWSLNWMIENTTSHYSSQKPGPWKQVTLRVNMALFPEPGPDEVYKGLIIRL